MNHVDVSTSVGYALKRATSALRAAMDAQLRELGLSVPQYACLELLAARPGLSNAELARGVFVSRQATHQLLTGLTRTGLVDVHGDGRAQRLTPTERGSALLAAASENVRRIERDMLATLSADQQQELLTLLTECTVALLAARATPG